MKVRCSIPIFFSAFCVVASVIFSVFCIFLLLDERKEVGTSFLSFDRLKIHDKSIYTALKFTPNLTDEESVQSFLRKLENYKYQYHKLNLEKLFCVPLEEIEIFRNRSELRLEQVGDELADHLNATFYRSLLKEHKNASSGETRKNLKIFELTVLRFFRSRGYYILRDKICLVLDYFLFTEQFLEDLFRSVASAYAHMLIKDSHYVVRLKKSNDAFDLRLIFNHHNPNLNCSNNGTEFECLNSCLKEKHRLSRYFYNGNETGTIRLPGRLLNVSANSLIVEHEAACFRRCDKQLCVVTDFQTKNFEDKHSNVSIISENLIKVSFYEFKPLITTFSFWVQVTGLTLSFFGVSCYNLALKLTTNSLLQNKKLVHTVFKLLLWTVCVTVFLVLSKESIVNYSRKHGDRTAKTSVSYPRQPEMIGLVVCTPVDIIMSGKIDKLTFAELENGTNDAFNRTVNELYLEYLNERYELNWKINKQKVLFNADDYSSRFGRCFQVEIEAAEPEFRTIWNDLKLVITFNQPNYEMYILPEGQMFNYNSFRFDLDKTAKFNKVIFKSSPLKCVDYRKVYGNCDNRWSCLDACVINKSVEYELGIPILQAIDKDLLDPIDWEIVLPNYNLKGNPRLEDECREEISSPDCYRIFFERDPNGLHDSTSDWSKVKIDLFNPIMLKTAADDSGYDVLLDLLNVVQIIFDLQALKLLTTVVFFFKIKVFELHFVTRKLFLYPVYVLCLAGFVLHVAFIFDQVQNSRLVFSNYYEELATQPMPELNFCFQHGGWSAVKKELNSTGSLLTGDHLERATHDLRADTVFTQIQYLSSENRWVELNLSGVSANEPRFQRQNVHFERFYISDKKCLSIWLNQSYHRTKFYFDDTYDGTYQVMRLNFNRSFITNAQKDRSVVFYTRTNDKRFLSDIKFLNFSSPHFVPKELKTSYKVLQIYFEIINNDKFRLAKNPLSFGTDRFSNVGNWLKGLKKEFRQRHNAATLELPLTEQYFRLPVNDTLFREWDRGNGPKEEASKNQPDGGLIYERSVVENRVEKHYYASDNADFKFHLKFGKFKQVFRMKENLAKFILNLLNGLSLWLSISFFQTFVLKSGLFDDCDCVKSSVTPGAKARTGSKALSVTESSLHSRPSSI